MNNKLTKEQAGRLIKFGRRVWKLLTDAERDSYYCDTGTIGFVEDMAHILRLDAYDLSLKEFEAIHNMIIYYKGR